MSNQKIMVTSMTSGRIGIDLPDLRFKRVWEKKGSKKPIDLEILEQALYNPGVEYMFKEGILYIEDMDAKIKLGLEPEGAKEPENVIVLSDAQKKRLLTVAPMQDLKETVSKLSYEQIQDLVEYAIQNEITNMDKCEYLKKITQTDIIKAVQLNRANKEE